MKNKLWNICLILAIIGIIAMRFTYEPQKSENNLFVDGVVAAMIDWQPCIVNKNGEITAQFNEPDTDRPQLGSFGPDGIAVYYTDFYYLPSQLPAWMQGYVNTKGEMITEAEFTYAGDFYDGLAVAGKEGKLGIINTDMKYVIEPQFNGLKGFENDKYAPAKIGEKWGYINKKGEFVIEPQFDDAESFNGGKYAAVMVDKKYGLIGRKGNMIIEPKYDSIYALCGDFTIVNEMEQKWFNSIPHFSVLNIKTGEVIPLDYDNVGNFTENGLARVYKFAKWGFINTKGEEVIELQFREASDFENGLAVVKTKAKTLAYINESGEIVMEFEDFADLGHFHNGLAWFRDKNDKIGYINTDGKIAIEPKFDYIFNNNRHAGNDFTDDGYAVVRYESEDRNKGPRYGVIAKEGSFVLEPIYDYVG